MYTMKRKTIITLILIFQIVVLASCSDSETKTTTMNDISIGIKNTNNLEAMGAELDPHFFSQNLTRNDGSKESDWELVIDRVKAMKLKKFRVMVQPQWFEPVNDNADPHTTDFSKFTFESPEMQSLYKVLDLAQEENMDVCIVIWGCPVHVSMLDPAYAHIKTCFMADQTKKNVWITGPTDYDEWAENYSALIKHLRDVKGYTCVNEITPMNEPDGGPLLTSTEYIKMAKVLDARFKKDELRDKVRFNLSDNTDTRTFYLEDCAANLVDEADIFNSHTYIFGYDTPNSTILEWEKNNVSISARAGKKHIVGEFGSNQCVGATRQTDIDRYERGVLMSRLVLNFLNAGAVGVSYWSLIDQYYGKDADYQQMQQLGLWKYLKEIYKPDPEVYKNIKEDYEVRPQYYAYTLLTRFLTPDSEIYPLNLDRDFIAGTGFKDTTGKWTYVFANGSEQKEQFNLKGLESDSKFDCYIYTEKSLPTGDSLLEPKEQVKAKKESLYVTLEPQTVVLYRQK